MLLQHAAPVGTHPLSGTVASFLWLLPLLPLLGFVLNGLLSLTSAFHFGPDDPSASHDAHDTHGAAHAHDCAVRVRLAAGDAHDFHAVVRSSVDVRECVTRAMR